MDSEKVNVDDKKEEGNVEDEYHIEIIIEHNDKPTVSEIRSGYNQEALFWTTSLYIETLLPSLKCHRCVRDLASVFDLPDDLYTAVRFVPLKRFEVKIYLDGKHTENDVVKLHTDNPTDIMDWLKANNRQIVGESIEYYACKGYCYRSIWEFYDRKNPEELQEILLDFPAFLEERYAREMARCQGQMEAIYLEFNTKEKESSI